MTKLTGPIVLWSKLPSEAGYTPSNHPDVKTALGALTSADFYLTGPEAEIGIVKRKAPAKKKEVGTTNTGAPGQTTAAGQKKAA